MQDPQSQLIKSLANQVTKEWGAYGDKNVIFYQHLEPFDKAQEKLSLLIAQKTVNDLPQSKVETTRDFLTFFMKSVLKVRIKMEKYQKMKDDVQFTQYLDYVIETITNGKWTDIPFNNYPKILFRIGRIYERLGYSSPEKERTRTNMQSDMELPGTDTPEYMENVPTTDYITFLNKEE